MHTCPLLFVILGTLAVKFSTVKFLNSHLNENSFCRSASLNTLKLLLPYATTHSNIVSNLIA